jgi:N-acetylmuramoyl-L-alanine amidase
MTILDDIGARDIRHLLPRRDWQIGVRAATTSITWHWNGPEVAPEKQRGLGLVHQLQADAAWQMRPGWGGTVNGAPHLMYLLVFADDGTIYQTAGLDEILWHCAHADGNGRGLSLHFPLGEAQAPTIRQLLAATRATDLLRSAYRIPLARTLGHIEWKHATACPGPALMGRLMAYRASIPPVVAPTPTPAGLRRWQIRPDLTDNINVRQGPGVGFKVAGRMKPGTILFVDVEKDAEPVDAAHPRWVHMARVPNEQADLGFVAAELGAFL